MANYKLWNAAIVRHFFRADVNGHRVVLTTDSETLRQCMNEQAGEDDFDSEEDAVQDFIEAVLVEFRRRQNRWRVLRETSPDEDPDYVAFLAAQVLAAFSVGEYLGDDGEFASSFWQAIRDLFDDEVAPSAQFYDDQVEAWEGLVQWANVHKDGQLGRFHIPTIHRGKGTRWFVDLSYSQCLLRKSDLERLAGLFHQSELTPADAIHRDRSDQLVRIRLHDHRWFAPHVQRVMQCQHRHPDAISQIIEQLRGWDGQPQSSRASAARSGRNIELSIDIRSCEGKLRFRLFDVEKERAICQLSDRNIEEHCSTGIFRRISIDGVTYRPRAGHYLLAVEHPAINRFLTVNRVRPGERFRMLVHIQQQRKWMEDIYDICEPGSVRKLCSSHRQENDVDGSLLGLPTDWMLLEGTCRFSLSAVPEPWDNIVDERSARISTFGGLKLARGVWQTQAGPRILVSGGSTPSKLLIDGVEVPIDSSGCVTHSLLDTEGCHIISLAHGERRCRGLRVQVRDASLVPRIDDYSGWQPEAGKWPSQTIVSRNTDAAHVVGMSIYGHWRAWNESPATLPETLPVLEPAGRTMIRLLLSRRRKVHTGDTSVSHPLVKLLASRMSSQLSIASRASQSIGRGAK